MTDYVTYGASDGTINNTTNILAAVSVASGSVITDWESSTSAQYGVLQSSGPFDWPEAPALIYGWQIVAHGASPTNITLANANSGTYVVSGLYPFSSTSTSWYADGTSTIIACNWAGQTKEWSPQTTSALSDVYLCTNWNRTATYGAGAQASLVARVRFHGP